MGFEYTKYRPPLRLVFADPELNGLVVIMNRPNIDEAMFVGEFYATDHAAATAEKRQADYAHIHELIASKIVEWNMEIGGKPIPATLEGLRQIDGDLLGSILGAWLKGAAMVSDPLEQTSNGGGDSAVVPASIPMEPFSPNPSN